MPFNAWSDNKKRFEIFRNDISGSYEVIGGNGMELSYNIDEKVFKLHIHCRAKLYEQFENNFGDFPFEWQFLNIQLFLNIQYYSFVAEIPSWVADSFMFDEYWPGSDKVWTHAVLARKRASIEEWKLLSPWVDLRNDAQ
eukprot:387386_1